MAKSQELVLEKKVVREEVVEVIVEKEEDGEWWEAEITVPADAVALNFVVRYHATWDNNYGRDYKVLRWLCVCAEVVTSRRSILCQHLSQQIAVQPPKKFKSFEEWADSFLDEYTEEETRKREQKEAEERARRKKRLAKHSKNNEHAMAVRKRQMKHVLFTKPDTPMPGDTIEVYYNPQNTILAGKPNVFLRGGFNRWRHPKPFGPIQMIPPETGDHFRVRCAVKHRLCFLVPVPPGVPHTSSSGQDPGPDRRQHDRLCLQRRPRGRWHVRQPRRPRLPHPRGEQDDEGRPAARRAHCRGDGAHLQGRRPGRRRHLAVACCQGHEQPRGGHRSALLVLWLVAAAGQHHPGGRV